MVQLLQNFITNLISHSTVSSLTRPKNIKIAFIFLSLFYLELLVLYPVHNMLSTYGITFVSDIMSEI